MSEETSKISVQVLPLDPGDTLAAVSAYIPPVESAIEALLQNIDDNPQREGLKETPARVGRFWNEWVTSGDPSFRCTDFASEGFDEMVVQKNITFYSMCEHHLLPFFGVAAVCYIPNKRIIGLSKLARIVQWYARRPQNQERLTVQIADFLNHQLQPLGVGVVLKARHMCMEMREYLRRERKATDIWKLKGVTWE